MSGGVKNKVFVVDGRTFDIPEDESEAFLNDMQRAGKQVHGGDDDDAPVPTSQPQERTQPDPPKDDGGIIGTLADLAVKFGLAQRGDDANAPARAAAPAYNARMQEYVDQPGKTATREVASLAAPLIGGTATRGLAGQGAQMASSLTQSIADDVDPIDALKGMFVASGLHGAGEAAFAAQKGLGNAGLRSRLSAAGMDFDELAKEKGAPAAYQLARDIEEKGLHKGSGPLGFLPQPAGTYAQNAGNLVNSGRAGMSSAEQGLAQLPKPPQVNWNPIEQQMRASAGKNANMVDPAGAQEAAFRNQMADRIGQLAGGENGGWNEALANRRYLDSNINYGSRGGYEGAPMQEQVRRDVANPLRQEISASLDRGMASGDVPENLGRGWQNARDDFALGSTVQPDAQALQAQQASQGFFTPASAASAAAAAGGFYTGHPVAGLAAGVGAQLARTRGSSAMAGGLGAMSGEAGNVGDWLTKTAGVAGGGDVAQTLMNRGRPAQPDRDPASTNARPFDATRDPAMIDQMLHNPQTAMQLSEWKDDLTAAANSDDNARWEAGIEKLYRTKPAFRALFTQGDR